MRKSFKRGLTVFAKANNLLDTPLRVYIQNTNPKNEELPFQNAQPGQTLVREDHYQRSYMLGVRFRLMDN